MPTDKNKKYATSIKQNMKRQLQSKEPIPSAPDAKPTLTPTTPTKPKATKQSKTKAVKGNKTAPTAQKTAPQPTFEKIAPQTRTFEKITPPERTFATVKKQPQVATRVELANADEQNVEPNVEPLDPPQVISKPKKSKRKINKFDIMLWVGIALIVVGVLLIIL